MRNTIGDQRLSYSETQTFLFEVANVLNERPIGMLPSADENTPYLCPNDCLLGRTKLKAPCADYDVTFNSKKRVWFIQRMTDLFWRKWTIFYFPSLIIRKKWHTEHRNLTVDDIVIIQDKDLPRGQWKTGIVTKAEPSSDGKVRHVSIKYKNPMSSSFVEVDRPVQKLVVLLSAEEREHVNHD